MIKSLKNKKGFTLTELIVVIVIIGILAVVLIPTLTGYIRRANESADNSEVQGLNQLLIEAKTLGKEFASVNQLKEYLENEMDYDNDYTLRVKGDYLWYDTKNYQFIIIGEDDNDALNAADESPIISKNLKSPEGLLQYQDGSELWLVGGNGYLVKVVEEIRSVGNTGKNLGEFKNIKNDNIKNALSDFFANNKFVGSSGEFIINSDGSVRVATSDDKSLDSVYSDYIVETASLFHKEVIEPNINLIKTKLAGTGISLDLKEGYNIELSVTDGASLSSTAYAVLEIMSILMNEGCIKGYIIPKQYMNVTNYNKVLTEIIAECSNQSSTKVTSELRSFYETLKGKFNNIDSLYAIDLRSIDLEDSNKLIDFVLSLQPLLTTSLGVYDKNGVYTCYEGITQLNLETFLNKNELTLIGELDSNTYGNIEIRYNMKFVDNRTK